VLEAVIVLLSAASGSLCCLLYMMAAWNVDLSADGLQVTQAQTPGTLWQWSAALVCNSGTPKRPGEAGLLACSTLLQV